MHGHLLVLLGSFLGGLFGLIFSLLYMGIFVVIIAGMWKLFEKAGKPGWACLIPIYNIIVMMEITGKPIWQIVLFIVPLANLYVAITLGVSFCRSYGKFGLGNYLFYFFLGFIALPMWGFSPDTRYLGPSEGPNATAGNAATSPSVY
jgi:hypothetical protein